MEFKEKLQELRKQKGITQEDLAEALYVSRTAISKWESGRGYPNIESLKAISKFFGVTIDVLLSGEELLDVAENDSKQKETHIRNILFGLLDISVLILFFLPFFGQNTDSLIKEVSLLSIEGISNYLKFIYTASVFLIALCGIFTLAFQNSKNSLCTKTSLLLNFVGVIIFIAGSQPYAAVFLFIHLSIKALTLIKLR